MSAFHFAFYVDDSSSTITPVDGVSFAPDEQLHGEAFDIFLDHGLVSVQLGADDAGMLTIMLHAQVCGEALESPPPPVQIDTSDLQLPVSSFGRLWRNADHPQYVYLAFGERELHIKAESEGVIFDVWTDEDVEWTGACAFEDIVVFDEEGAAA